jgi:uncharacterized protein with PQ loop repeat
MVSWKKAFEASASVLLYSIGFVIAGLVVIYWGGYGALINVAYRGYYTNSQLPEITIALVSIIIGMIIMALGPMASFMKVFTDLLESEKQTPSVN